MPLPSGALQTIEVAIRNGKFTYCRSQIIYESCSSRAGTMSSAAFLDGHVYLVISISRVSSIIEAWLHHSAN